MLNEKFWLAVSFGCFVALMIKFVAPIIIRALNSKSETISNQLNEAKKAKEEAEKLLKKAKKYNEESKAFAENLLKEAEAEALEFSNKAQKEAQNEIAKKTAASLDRIKMEEQLAIRQIKQKIISSTMAGLNKSMADDINQDRHNHLLDQALNDLENS